MLAGEGFGAAPWFLAECRFRAVSWGGADDEGVIDFRRIAVHPASMSIQGAVRDVHEAISMPVMAPIVVDRPAASDAVERDDTRTGARLAGFEHDVAQFVAASGALARQLREAGSQPDEGSAVSDLTDFVEHLERMAEWMPTDDARTEKDMLRDARLQERRDAGLAAAHRRAAMRLASLNARIVETLLALALEVRALRSTLIGSESSPVFDDSGELARYLDEAIRA